MAAFSPNVSTADSSESSTDNSESIDAGGDSTEVGDEAALTINMLQQQIIHLQQALNRKEVRIAKMQKLLDNPPPSWCTIVVRSVITVPFAYIFLQLLSTYRQLSSQPDATVLSWKSFIGKLVGAYLLPSLMIISGQVCDTLELPEFGDFSPSDTICVVFAWLNLFIALSCLFVLDGLL